MRARKKELFHNKVRLICYYLDMEYEQIYNHYLELARFFRLEKKHLDLIKSKNFEQLYFEIFNETDNDFEASTLMGALLTRYLLANGHQDFIDYMSFIPSYCFAFTGIEEIRIGKGVKEMGENIFYGCPDLAKITVDPLNEAYDSRDNCNAIISKDRNILHFGCKATVIPSSVIAIEEDAFGNSLPPLNKSNCGLYVGVKDNPYYMFYGLTNSDERTFVMDERCQLMRDAAFKDAKELRLVQISTHVKAISYEAFKGCVSLKSVILPPDLTSIDYNAFEDCKSLTEFTFPEGIEVITYDVLKNCYGLEAVTIHSRVKEIKLGVISNCRSLKRIIYKGKIDDFYNIKGIEEWLFDMMVNQIELECEEGSFTSEQVEQYRKEKENEAKADIIYHDELLGCSYQIPYDFIEAEDKDKYEMPENYIRFFVKKSEPNILALTLWKKAEACNENEYIQIINDRIKELEKEKAKKKFEHYYQGNRRIDVITMDYDSLSFVFYFTLVKNIVVGSSEIKFGINPEEDNKKEEIIVNLFNSIQIDN